MFFILLAGCSAPLAISVIVLSVGMNGAAAESNIYNFQDLSPMFTSAIFGIAKSIGNTTGFLTPLVTSLITLNKVSTRPDH